MTPHIFSPACDAASRLVTSGQITVCARRALLVRAWRGRLQSPIGFSGRRVRAERYQTPGHAREVGNHRNLSMKVEAQETRAHPLAVARDSFRARFTPWPLADARLLLNALEFITGYESLTLLFAVRSAGPSIQCSRKIQLFVHCDLSRALVTRWNAHVPESGIGQTGSLGRERTRCARLGYRQQVSPMY